jgi:beta-fructofuranosidase
MNLKILGSISVFIALLFGYSQSSGQVPAGQRPPAQTPAGQRPPAPVYQPPYTSATPHFTFGKTLKEQEDQLKNNPLMLRFAESRKALMAANPNRPIYHMFAAEGRLGDPNGLAFWQGNWHLFYQAWPTDDSRQHWGHVVSKDLVHWRDLPYAIYPNPEIKVYSGSTLVEDNRVIAMYYGTAKGDMVAVSDDPLLLNWNKILKNGGAVIPTMSSDGSMLPYVVFDACIWNKDGTYYSLAGGKRAPETALGGKPPQAMAYLFKSKDLVNWDYVHEFVEGDRYTMLGDDYACPYFWPLGDKYILIFFSHNSGGQFLLGDYDKTRDKFIATFGSGPKGLAQPSSTPDGKGRVVVVYAVGGVLGIPRLLTLLGPDEVGQEPAPDFSSLHYDARQIGKTLLPANQEVVLNGISGNTMEISAEIDPKGSHSIELNVLRSPGNEEYTRILISKGPRTYGRGIAYIQGPGTALMPDDLVPLFIPGHPGRVNTGFGRGAGTPGPQPKLLTIESYYAGNFSAPLTGSFLLSPGESIKLRVFIDKGLVEVFVNGKQALSTSVNPSRLDSKSVSIKSHGQDAELISLDAWQMKGIYDANSGMVSK